MPSSSESSSGDGRFGRGDFLKRSGYALGAGVLASPLLRAAPALAADRSTSSLSVWYLSQNPAEIKVAEAYSAAFGRKDHLHVKVSPYTYNGFNKAFPLALQAHAGPDAAYANPGIAFTTKWGTDGLLEDLTPFVHKRGWDKHLSQDTIWYWNKPGNKVWAVAYDLAVVGNFYNKHIFDHLKLKPPKTFPEYQAALAKIKKAGITPFAVGGKDGYTLVWMIDQIVHGMVRYSYLNRLNNTLDSKVSWNIPAFVKAATIVQDWASKGYFQNGFLGMSISDGDQYFINGHTAIDLTGSWNNSLFVSQAKFPVRFFATPRVNPNLPWHLGDYTPNNAWCLPKNGKNQAAALKYLDWVLGEEAARALWNSGDVVAYEFKKVPPAKSPLQLDVYRAARAAKMGSYGANSSAQVLADWVSILQQLTTGKLTPAQAVSQVQDAYATAVKNQ